MTPPCSLHIKVYWPSPGPILRMSFVKTELRKSDATAPLTVISPMCEISKIPAAFRTARCSSVILVYCTGISQPSKSTSLAPNFWCAAKRGVRFNMNEECRRNKESSTPLLSFHLGFGHAKFENNTFCEFNQSRRAAGVENGFSQIPRMLFKPRSVNSAAPPGPSVVGHQAGAGDVEFEMGILFFELSEFVVENDVVRRSNTVQDRDSRLEFSPRGLAHKSAERRDTRTA